jgi:hypothetical protein
MRIHFQGRFISFEELCALAAEQKTEAWLIGELHGNQSGYDFNKACIKAVRPEYVLSESFSFDPSNEVKEGMPDRDDYNKYLMLLAREQGFKVVDCDIKKREAFDVGPLAGIVTRYGTKDLKKIAREVYGFELSDEEAKDPVFFLLGYPGEKPVTPKQRYMAETSEAVSKAIEQIRETGMGMCLEENIRKISRPVISIVGAAHVSSRAGNLFAEISRRKVVVLTPFEIKGPELKRVHSEEFGECIVSNDPGDLFGRNDTIMSYNAMFLYPDNLVRL